MLVTHMLNQNSGKTIDYVLTIILPSIVSLMLKSTEEDVINEGFSTFTSL